jgi:hypothetical protein
MRYEINITPPQDVLPRWKTDAQNEKKGPTSTIEGIRDFKINEFEGQKQRYYPATMQSNQPALKADAILAWPRLLLKFKQGVSIAEPRAVNAPWNFESPSNTLLSLDRSRGRNMIILPANRRSRFTVAMAKELRHRRSRLNSRLCAEPDWLVDWVLTQATPVPPSLRLRRGSCATL